MLAFLPFLMNNVYNYFILQIKEILFYLTFFIYVNYKIYEMFIY